MRTLTFALAAGLGTVGASVQAAAPISVPARSGANLGQTNQLAGNSEWIPVVVFMLAVLSIMLFDDDDEDVAVSP
jgi:Mrp family chromosome partitioning ATPase